jgi:GH25 family lysozyme M1 (1,4-beta-N-acetylmuramidase)
MTTSHHRIIACALLALSACSTSYDAEPIEVSTQQDLCNGGSNVEGVDVSHWQGTGVNWSAVRTTAGSFAIAKASEGTGISDDTFSTNWPALRSNGFVRGAYHFFIGGLAGAAQADRFMSAVNASGGFLTGDLPPAVDVEVIGLSGNPAGDVSRLHDLLNRLQATTGRLPIIYTNNETWRQLGNPSGFESYPVWLANWGATCTSMPPGLVNLKFWQYTSTGSVPGISGSVDRDRFNGTASDLIAFAGGSSGATTCDNNVPVGGTACNPADPGAQFVCTSPGLPSNQQWTRQPCSSGQSCSGTHCQGGGGVPACGFGLFCAGNQIPGSSACMSGASTIFCCAPGQQIVNGVCMAPPPPCGAGLFCAGNPIPGASACMSGTQLGYCCAPGHTIVNGACF